MKRDNTILWVAGGALGLWYILRHMQPGPGDKAIGNPSHPPPALGDPNDPGSVAFACNAAWRMTALGHPQQAAPWIPICQKGGGTIPTSADQQYK